MKNKKLKKVLKYIFIIALFLFSFWYLLKDLNLNEIKNNIDKMNIYFLIPAVLLIFGQIFVQGFCYIVMSKGLEVKLNPIKASKYVSVDLFFSQLTPFAIGGQPMMVYEMKSKDGIEVAKSTPMVLIYSFMNKLALIVMAIVVSIFYFNDFFAQSDSKIMIILLIFGVCSNIIIASLSIMFMFMGSLMYKIGIRLILWFYKHNLIKNPLAKVRSLRVMVKNYKESNKYFKNHKLTLLFVFLLCVLKRVITFSVAYVIYKSFGLKEHSFIYIISAQTVYALVSDSFPIPGGIGAAEVSIKHLYDGIYETAPTGISGLAAVLVRFISYYLLIIITGITTMGVMFRKNGKKVYLKDEESMQ